MKTISYIFTSLVACQCFMWWLISRFTSLRTLHEQWTRAMMTHRAGIFKTISQPLYFIVVYGSTVVSWHDESSPKNLFLEEYPISPSLFVFRGSNTKLFSTIYLLYFYDMLWDDRNIRTHLTTNHALHMTSPLTHPHRLCSPTRKSPHSTWHDDNSSHIGRAPIEWQQLTLTPALIAHMKTPSESVIIDPLFRAHSLTCMPIKAYIKRWFAYVNYDLAHV